METHKFYKAIDDDRVEAKCGYWTAWSSLSRDPTCPGCIRVIARGVRKDEVSDNFVDVAGDVTEDMIDMAGDIFDGIFDMMDDIIGGRPKRRGR